MWAIFDTNVYIDYWEGRLVADHLAAIHRGYVIRQSAVVLSELRRGAHTLKAKRLVDELFCSLPVCWEPSADDWWEAGRLIALLGGKFHWDIHKRREFQNDALIALTARRWGATIVTSNRGDFALLEEAVQIRVHNL